LRAPLALVHGNHPQPGEPARIALAGAVVVHCPGSHAWFERASFPLERYRRAGVPVALGTDSLASNEDLDLGREMRLSMESFPGLGPLAAWAMATESGAKALGLEGRVGSLEVGSWADVAVHRCDATALRGRIEELAWGASRVESTWVGGRLAAGRIP
jgi:cytosine/adenosine deaminase-related metal-dependent hydrolase